MNNMKFKVGDKVRFKRNQDIISSHRGKIATVIRNGEYSVWVKMSDEKLLNLYGNNEWTVPEENLSLVPRVKRQKQKGKNDKNSLGYEHVNSIGGFTIGDEVEVTTDSQKPYSKGDRGTVVGFNILDVEGKSHLVFVRVFVPGKTSENDWHPFTAVEIRKVVAPAPAKEESPKFRIGDRVKLKKLYYSIPAGKSDENIEAVVVGINLKNKRPTFDIICIQFTDPDFHQYHFNHSEISPGLKGFTVICHELTKLPPADKAANSDVPYPVVELQLKVGDRVRTKTGDVGTLVAIQANTIYPCVVAYDKHLTIEYMRDTGDYGTARLHHYEANQLTRI